GNYSLKMPPATYRPVPIKTGFVFDAAAGLNQTVSAGQMAACPDVVLTVSSRTISGTIRDDTVPPVPLSGLGVYGQSQSGKFSFSFADASGNYVLDAAPGEMEVGVVEQPLALLGIVAKGGFHDGSAGSISGFHLDLPRATALIYGTLRTPGGVAVPFIDVSSETQSGPELQSTGVTDATGNYSLGVVPGSWPVGAEPAGYVVTWQTVAAVAGSAVEQNLTARPVTAHLRGKVVTGFLTDDPVPGVRIMAQDTINTSVDAVTDSEGNFDLGVYGGGGGTAKQWFLRLSEDDGGESSYAFMSTGFPVVDGTDINGISYHVYQKNAHLRGFVRDEVNAAVGGIEISITGQNTGFEFRTTTLGDGSFDIACFQDGWLFGLGNGPGLLPLTNTVANVTGDVNGFVFHVHHLNGTFSGIVKNTQGTGIGGIRVSAVIDGNGPYTSSAVTNQGGNYSLPVYTGNWTLSLNNTDLSNQGYLSPPAQNVNINTGNVMVNFVASAAQQSYLTWKNSKFTAAEAADPLLSGPLADFDHDGTVNLMEYALNLDPKIAGFDGLPVPGILQTTPGSPPFGTLTFHRWAGVSGLSYTVQTFNTASNAWANLTPGLYEVLSSDGTVETVRVKVPPAPGGATYLLRLQVTQSP
ncbi:MAG TPA: carboxypeptidase-like regulatory domain-containing protein, partial [Verrucomicrobiales bacterium]|nr:carboxypeptidase-like regulatory domain-containing protein [Verrucomicrobiales bacterium]